MEEFPCISGSSFMLCHEFRNKALLNLFMQFVILLTLIITPFCLLVSEQILKISLCSKDSSIDIERFVAKTEPPKMSIIFSH